MAVDQSVLEVFAKLARMLVDNGSLDMELATIKQAALARQRL